MTKVVALPASFTRPPVADGVGLGVLFQSQPPDLEALQQALGAAGLPLQITGGDALGGSANRVTVIVKSLSERLPCDLEMGADLALTWPELRDIVDSYRAGVMITAHADAEDVDPFELHGIAMLAASTVAGLPGAAAVYNDDARVYSRPAEYRAIMPEVFNGTVPVMHWFAVWPAQARGGEPLAITNGLKQFGLPELAVSGDGDLGDAAQALWSFAYDGVARLRENRDDILRPGDSVTVMGGSGETAQIVALTEAGYTVRGIDVPDAYYEVAFHNQDLLDRLFGEADDASRSAPQPLDSAQPAPQPSSSAAVIDSATTGSEAPQQPSLPPQPARGLVLLGAPIDLTQVAQQLQQRGMQVTRVDGPQLEAHAGAFTVALSGRPGPVPDQMWTVQPPQAVCFNQQMPPQVCHVVVEVNGRPGAHGSGEQQRLALEHTLATVADRPQAVAVVLETDTEATPAGAYAARHR